MAIRNIKLGGASDFAFGESPVASEDINDTFDAVLKKIGVDTEGSIASSVSETIIATVIIPADKVVNGIIVMASIHFKTQNASGSADTGTFKLKIGPTGSEGLKQTQIMQGAEHGVGNVPNRMGGCLMFFDNSQNWAAEVTILVTAQNSVSGAGDISTCYQLVVFGI